ncbi:MAG: glucose-1-phosphate cytidylyltransferase [Candidatus Omnitrophica bacterium]|nr:glucose-1-phosphate cytidylyltransferase [Candidatus Omnitrophota bacterium]
MKVVILAGGRGTRISEETGSIPKPMVEIGGKPIIWHIMKIYSHFGFNDFIICLGYKGYMIKEYFSHYFLHMSDVTIDLKKDDVKVRSTSTEPWKVTLVDTGLDTMTGGRLRRVQKYIGNKTFMMTYGDGVSDVDIKELLKFHKRCGKHATVTAVQLAGRFGALNMKDKGVVTSFLEKPKGDGSWINGGFFVLEPEVFNYISGDNSVWEFDSLKNMAVDKQLTGFKHSGFWKCMDTLRDRSELEAFWDSARAPWKKWKV